MMATAGQYMQGVLCIFIKQVTFDRAIIYFTIKKCDGSKCLLLRQLLMSRNDTRNQSNINNSN
jgi:hypothetical protein